MGKTTDRLDLRSARVELNRGYALLVLDIAGRTVRLDTEWHPALREMGLVNVTYVVADLVPERTYVDPASGDAHPLTGYTDDPVIYALYERFWGDELSPGPVALALAAR